MGKVLEKPQDSLYEQDFYAWLNDQTVKLRARSHNEIDWDNLAEEIESVARSQKREIESRLAQLILHLLKWQFQPGRRSESWRISISEQRTWIPGILKQSPSLKSYPEMVFDEAFLEGRRKAIDETGIIAKTIPKEPPFTVERALDSRFLPGESFEQWAILRD